jgi:hypothetical protein
MIKKKILFVGCSFTERSGFDDVNLTKYHWPFLVSDYFDCYYQNAGIGGSSNEEIFYRTIELTSSQYYDLVVIMWSNLGRKWIYFSEPNIDDFTIVNPGVAGLRSDSSEVKTFHRLYIDHFNNSYVSLKHWLEQIVCLQSYFKCKSQSCIFVKGFDNRISDFDNIIYSENKFENISDEIKLLLNFDNNPDHILLNKVEIIQQLIKQVDLHNWIDFKRFNFFQSAVDQADDQLHPGPITNYNMSLDLIDHIRTRNLLG